MRGGQGDSILQQSVAFAAVRSAQLSLQRASGPQRICSRLQAAPYPSTLAAVKVVIVKLIACHAVARRSSRSHAIFTITLEQRRRQLVRPASAPPAVESTPRRSGMQVIMAQHHHSQHNHRQCICCYPEQRASSAVAYRGPSSSAEALAGCPARLARQPYADSCRLMCSGQASWLRHPADSLLTLSAYFLVLCRTVTAAAVGMTLRMTQQKMRRKRWKLPMSTSLPRCDWRCCGTVLQSTAREMCLLGHSGCVPHSFSLT